MVTHVVAVDIRVLFGLNWLKPVEKQHTHD